MKAARFLTSVAFATGLATVANAEDVQRVVTVVTSPEPQTQLMSMVLTMQAMNAGADAQILLCGPGGDIALQDAPAKATNGQPPRDMSPQGAMQMLMQNGLKVQVCAIYLPGEGQDESVLIDGVTVAAPPAMAADMMAPNTTIMSF